MSIIRGPFIKFKCGGCGRWIERNISARRAAQELSDLCDGAQLYCAPCEQWPSERQKADRADIRARKA